MKLHSNARTCPHCRLLIVAWTLHDHRPVAVVAREFRISVRTVRKWIKRYGEYGAAGLDDKTPDPHAVPRRLIQPGPVLGDAIMTLLHTPPSTMGSTERPGECKTSRRRLTIREQ